MRKHCDICGATETRDAQGVTYRLGRIEGKRVCASCWPSVHAEYLDRTKRDARRFWDDRGIRPRQAIHFRVGTLFGPALAHGVARVGRHGAYIASARYPGRKIDPSAFHSAA